jgi:hypothetical protein
VSYLHSLLDGFVQQNRSSGGLDAGYEAVLRLCIMRRFPVGKSVAVAYPVFFSYCGNPSLIITQGSLSSTKIWDLGEPVFAALPV